VSAALTALTLGGARVVLERTLSHEYRADKVLQGMHQLRASRPAQVLRDPPDERIERLDGESLLDRIRRRGAIRVGYLEDGIPYSFFNASGELVGFDMEMAHELAEELDVGLELVPVDRLRLAEQLDGSYCDLIMAGIVVTTRRARDLLFSAPYMDETLAFLVPDHRRSDFGSAEAVREMTPLRLAVPNLPGFDVFLRERLPHAELVPFDNPRRLFRETAEEVDAILMTAERGSAWSLLHPELSVVVPQPDPARLPLAYAVADHDEPLKELVDIWIEIKKRDGTLREAYDYWILGREAERRERRWSVIRNVLHWVD
jgi:ABC-type amino acid transport substrate-binding protein